MSKFEVVYYKNVTAPGYYWYIDETRLTETEEFEFFHWDGASPLEQGYYLKIDPPGSNQINYSNTKEQSNGNWEFQFQSGYPGYKCTKCCTWIYESKPFICNCGTH